MYKYIYVDICIFRYMTEKVFMILPWVRGWRRRCSWSYLGWGDDREGVHDPVGILFTNLDNKQRVGEGHSWLCASFSKWFYSQENTQFLFSFPLFWSVTLAAWSSTWICIGSFAGPGLNEWHIKGKSFSESVTLEMRRVPMPEPVPPPREWVSWNPWDIKNSERRRGIDG